MELNGALEEQDAKDAAAAADSNNASSAAVQIELAKAPTSPTPV